MGLILGLAGTIKGATTPSGEVPTGTYTYQVTISEDVNFVEFNEKYKIIKQEGKIYTIKDKITEE